MATIENHTNVRVTRIVMKAKKYSEELILENLTGNLIHEVYKQLRNKIFALYVQQISVVNWAAVRK